ncbi:hypothetical protein ACQ4PT_066578 [Festuca glaucescens]
MAGVSAGTGTMSSLLGKLTALLGDEYTLLTGVRKEVEFLRDELGTMQSLQKTLADMHNLEPHEKVWKGNLRELSYDFEDLHRPLHGSPRQRRCQAQIYEEGQAPTQVAVGTP